MMIFAREFARSPALIDYSPLLSRWAAAAAVEAVVAVAAAVALVVVVVVGAPFRFCVVRRC